MGGRPTTLHAYITAQWFEILLLLLEKKRKKKICNSGILFGLMQFRTNFKVPLDTINS